MSKLPEASREAFRWLGQAMEDLDTARHVHKDPKPPRISCFLAHLTVEKALKALLINVDTPSRRRMISYACTSSFQMVEGLHSS